MPRELVERCQIGRRYTRSEVGKRGAEVGVGEVDLARSGVLAGGGRTGQVLLDSPGEAGLTAETAEVRAREARGPGGEVIQVDGLAVQVVVVQEDAEDADARRGVGRPEGHLVRQAAQEGAVKVRTKGAQGSWVRPSISWRNCVSCARCQLLSSPLRR